MKKTNVFIASFGHSNRSFAEFSEKLTANKIEVLVDVRTVPQSRFCPYFNLKALQEAFQYGTIRYLYRGKNLGGRGLNVNYEEAIDELVGMAKAGKRVCVVCSEADYRNCHRYTMLTPSFEARGVGVIHLQYDAKKPPGRK